jgi:Cytochrome P450
MYPDPENFRPERWLDASFPTYKEPLTEYPCIKNHHQFGFGRRVCQGQDLVETELCLMIGAMAWACTASKKRTVGGIEIPVPWIEYTSLLIAKPEKFLFDLKPRSPERQQQAVDQWEQVKEKVDGKAPADHGVKGEWPGMVKIAF